jgi:hypothetical protein
MGSMRDTAFVGWPRRRVIEQLTAEISARRRATAAKAVGKESPMKRTTMMTMVAGALATLLVGAAAASAEMRLRCESRSGRSRSKISVDGRDVPQGTYTVTVTSGANSASDTKASVGDEVEFDFDSATGEIGDVSIPGNFIQNGQVCATITGNVTLNGCTGCRQD